MQQVSFKDLGVMEYKKAWDYQEALLQENVAIKSEARKNTPGADVKGLPTKNHLLFCEHPPVYTLGKSGNIAHVLLTQEQLEQKQISFFHTNRGGDCVEAGS